MVNDKGMITIRSSALYKGSVGDLSVSRCLRRLCSLAGRLLSLPLRSLALAPLLQPAQYLGGRFDLVGGDVVVELGVPIEGASERDALQHRDPLLFGHLAHHERLGIGVFQGHYGQRCFTPLVADADGDMGRVGDNDRRALHVGAHIARLQLLMETGGACP